MVKKSYFLFVCLFISVILIALALFSLNSQRFSNEKISSITGGAITENSNTELASLEDSSGVIVFSPSNFLKWDYYITGNESVLYDLKSLNKTKICIIPKDVSLKKVVKEVDLVDKSMLVGSSKGQDKKYEKINVTYDYPDSITLYEGKNKDVVLKKSLSKDKENDNSICFDINSLTSLFYKLGEMSIVLSGVTTYNSTNTNVTDENKFSHLNLTDGSLVLYMPFDIVENSSSYTLDYSNYSNDGYILYGGVSPTYNATGGKFGGTYSFDKTSSNQWISISKIGSQTLGIFNNSGKVSYSLWIKPDVVDWSGVMGSENIKLHIDSGGVVTFTLLDDSSNLLQLSSSSGYVSTGTWQHIVVTYNRATGNQSIYYNGGLIATQNSPRAELYYNGGDFFYIGQDWNDYFDGSVDEVMVFNRTLSINEVRQIYNATYSRFFPAGEMLFKNISFVTKDMANISISNCQQLNGSLIKVKINNGAYSTLNSSCMYNDYSISGNLTNANMTLQLNSSTVNFFSPLVAGDVNINPYYSSGAPLVYAWSGELITNGGFEWNNLTGWTTNGASWLTGAHPPSYNASGPGAVPQAGSYCVYDNSGSSINYYIQQDVNLTSYASYIDSGTAVINASGWAVSAEPVYDQYKIQIFFLDSSKNVISALLDSGYVINPNWTQYGISTYYIPVNTRYIRMWGNVYEDSNEAGSLDSFSVKLGYETTGDTTAPTITLDPSVPSNTTSTTSPLTILANISDASNTSSWIDLDRSLVGYWAMDYYNATGVYDNSTYNKFGIFSAGTGLNYTNLTTGARGQALSFDGVNDYINITSPAMYLTPTQNNQTDAAWIKLSASQPSTNANIWGDYDGPSIYLVKVSGDVYDIKWYNGGGSSGSSDVTLTPGIWYHIALVKTNTVNISFYLNGQLISSMIPNSEAPITPDNLWIGGDAGGEWFNGSIDEVMIFNRSLSSTEVKALYDSKNNNFSTASMSLSNGQHNYTIYAIDQSGNTANNGWNYFNVTPEATPVNCGDSLSTVGTTYTLTGNVSSTGTCFSITAANITLDCNNFWITYSTSGTNDQHGILTNQYNTTIKNCNILDGNLADTDTWRNGIYFSFSNYSTAFNNTVRTNSSNSFYSYGSNSINLTRNYMRADNSPSIYLTNQYNTTLVNNTGLSNKPISGTGMYLGIVSNSTLFNNNGTGSYRGIDLLVSSNNNLTNNWGEGSSSSSDVGIILEESSMNNTLINNTGKSPGIGIYFWAFSANNTLINNTAISSSPDGIGSALQIQNSSNNLIIGQTALGIGSNSLGILIYEADNNLIKDCVNITSTNYNVEVVGGTPLSTNNTFINCSYSISKEYVYGGSAQLIRKWYYQAYANYSNGTAAAGVNITATNTTGRIQFTQNTSATGFITRQELIEYNNSVGARTFYSNYTINASIPSALISRDKYNLTNVQNNVTDFFTFAGTGGDLTSPTYSQVSVNNTLAGLTTLFSINVNDNLALQTNGQYVFSTNNSGAWINYSIFGSSNYWQKDLGTNASLPSVGSYSAPTVFYKDSSWYLISGNSNGGFAGYAWNGTNWKVNTTINASLFNDTNGCIPTVFYKDSSWYFLTGDYDGKFYGYAWNGTQWLTNLTINSSLPSLGYGFVSAPTVFYKDSSWYLISGNASGKFYGFTWNGTGWTVNITINASLPDIGSYSTPSVFYKDSSWYLISGSGSIDGKFYGYKWNGANWVVDLTINASLTNFADYTVPSVFYKDGILNLIAGGWSGNFYGYNYSSSYNFTTTPSWANVTTLLNSTVGTGVGYRWYFNDNASNANSTPIYILITTGGGTDTFPVVTLSYPYDNYFNSTNQFVNITFNASVTDDKNLVNCSLWTNYSGTWSLNQTQVIVGITNITNITINYLTNKTFIWNVQCYDNASQASWGSANRTVKLNYTAADTTPPMYSHNSTNNTVAGQITNFAINVSDNVALNPNGMYIFATNNTWGNSTLMNDSPVFFSTTPSWANVTKILNSTIGKVIGYKWYFNDSAGNTNSTPVYYLNTTAYSDTIPPVISLIPPTPSNTTSPSSSVEIVANISDASNTSSWIDIDRSLIGYWAMDYYNKTVIFDNSTYRKNATFPSGTGLNYTNLTTGPRGQALKFDGGNDYLDLGTPSSLMSINSAYTISAWVNPATLAQNGIIMDIEPTNTDYAYAFGIYQDDDSLLVGSLNYQYDVAGISSYLTAGKWQHWVIVFHSDYSIEFYLDGVKQTLSYEGGYYGRGGNMIGARNYADYRYFNGSIDEVMVFNRSLSSTEVKALYDSKNNNFDTSTLNLANGQHNYTVYAVDQYGNAANTGWNYFNLTGTETTDCTTLDVPGRTYYLTRDITYGGTCFPIGADNVTLDCQGHWITYGTDGNYNDYAIEGNEYANLTILNCNILDGYWSDAGGGSWRPGVVLNGNGSTMLRNFVWNNPYQAAVYTGGWNSNITNNTLLGHVGLYSQGAVNISVVNNNLSSSDYRGIDLSAETRNSVFIGNNISSGSLTEYGFIFEGSYNNLLINNTIMGPVAISIYNSGGVQSSNNTFINNTAISTVSTGTAIAIDQSDNNTFISQTALALLEGESSAFNIYYSNNTMIRDCVNVTGSGTGYDMDFTLVGGLPSWNTTTINCSYNTADDGGPNMQLINKWYYQVYVNDTSGSPVNGANITIKDVSNVLQFTELTNYSGWIQRKELIDYIDTASTKTYFSNYTINASKTTYAPSNKSYNATLQRNKVNDFITLTSYGSLFLNITNPRTSTPLSVTSGNNYSIYFNFSLGGSNITSDVTIDSVVISGVNATIISIPAAYNQITYGFTDYTNKTMYWGSSANALGASGGTNVSGANYTNIAKVDALIGKVCSDASNDELYERFNFTINEQLSKINWVSITWRGNYTTNGEGANLYLYNQTSESFINYTVIPSGNAGNITVNYSTAYNIQNLIGTNGQLVVYPRGENFDGGECLSTDYVEVLVGYIEPATPQFAYTSAGWQVNVTAPTFSYGLKDLFVNATYSGNTRNDTQVNAINYGVPPTAFTSTWDTTKTSSDSSNSTTIALPLEAGGIYNFNVDWGDGHSGTVTSWNDVDANHTYSSGGVYTLNITGTITGFRFNNVGDKLKIGNITSWGPLNVGNNGSYFYGCSNLNFTGSDNLDLTGVDNVQNMFNGATIFNGNISNWNTSSVTNMNSMFNSATSFNQNISGWNVSSVIDMTSMFAYTSVFNGNISNWNTKSVTTMTNMFQNAISFNQNIGGWNTSSVTAMDSMFWNATSFNQNLSNWNTGKVTSINNMFYQATSFNGNISNWDVSKATNMLAMFYYASSFNQNLSNWNTGNVTSMQAMFWGATFFNGNISNWNTGKVTSMDNMFHDDTTFNQSIGNWNTSSVTMMGSMFMGATFFNQNLSSWNVSSLTDAANMFYGVTLSTPNYDSLLIGWASRTPVLKNNTLFSGGNSRYTLAAANARNNILIGFHNWTITDGGMDSACSDISIPNTVFTLTQNATASGGCFVISADNVTLDCNNFWITYSTGGVAGDYGIYSSRFNTTIKNCNILDGNWSSLAGAFRYAIYFNTADNGTIFNNFANTSNSDGIYIYNGANFNNLTLNRGISNSSYGIYLFTSSNNNILANNTGISNLNRGICLNGVSNNILINNIGTGNGAGFAGIYLNGASNNILTNNNGTSVSGVGIWLIISSNNNLLTNNAGASSTNNGIVVQASYNNTLTNNNGTSSNSGAGVYLNDSSNNNLINNSGTSNSGYGLFMGSSSQNNTLTNNIGTSNSSYGISLSSSNNSILTSNTGISNTSIGIYLNSASNNTLIFNTGTSNTSAGIYIYLSSNNNNLTSNVARSNGIALAIDILSSNNNNLTNNTATISNGDSAIRIRSSNNTILVNNNGTSSGNGKGINIDSSFNNSLINNTGTSNSSYGIYLYKSSSNILTNNTATNNGGSASLIYYSNNNTLVNNKMISNGMGAANYGVWVSLSSNNTFIGQTAKALGTGSGNYGILIRGSNNTILRDSINISGGGGVDISYYPDAGSVNNTFINCSYNTENITAGNELIRKWYYRAYVNDTSGLPIQGASVTAYNTSNSLQFTDSTNSSGLTQRQEATEYVNTGGTISYYNNYTINATKSGYSTVVHIFNFTIMMNKMDDWFTLENGSCAYTGGNWIINCSAYCNVTSNVNVLGNNISIIGVGIFVTSANISNYLNLHIEGMNSTNICRVRCLNGGCFKN
jgi:parallel beta-helix repeat protein/surface protein